MKIGRPQPEEQKNPGICRDFYLMFFSVGLKKLQALN